MSRGVGEIRRGAGEVRCVRVAGVCWHRQLGTSLEELTGLGIDAGFDHGLSPFPEGTHGVNDQAGGFSHGSQARGIAHVSHQDGWAAAQRGRQALQLLAVAAGQPHGPAGTGGQGARRV